MLTHWAHLHLEKVLSMQDLGMVFPLGLVVGYKVCARGPPFTYWEESTTTLRSRERNGDNFLLSIHFASIPKALGWIKAKPEVYISI